jgi:hypothetical protein
MVARGPHYKMISKITTRPKNKNQHLYAGTIINVDVEAHALEQII